ncbi:uncharacterized protein [Nicotiana sylvestris]|uniref:uncharacterized protein n=1 Tax=Nicotiana sylvestris TaxID=4096 RepID=UPI00388C7C00
MADTSSAWQSRANVPQGDPTVTHLHKELHDHGQAIVELTTTMNQLVKAQLQQVQNPLQVNAMEGVNMLVNKRRQRGKHNQGNSKQFDNDCGGFQNDGYDEQREESLSINVPLGEALQQMLGYAKFIKDLVTKKRSMDCETIKMTHQLRPTFMRLQMVDRTMKRPLGIIDEVLVQVDKFILPADFVILDCEVDYEGPIILGRHFLAIGKALVDVKAGELTFRVGAENVVFHFCKSMKQPNSTEVCYFVDLVTAVIVDNTSEMINMEDPLEAVLLNLDVNNDEGRVECVNALHGMGSYSYEPRKLSLDLENRKTPLTKPSIEEPPVDATLAVLQK